MANVPGWKTDVADCAWIAQLLECRLRRGSFVPPPAIRELRDLTRYRKALIQDRTREANRRHKLLEDAGLKLASVATDVLGASGRAMLTALVAGTTDPAVLADLARGRLRAKLPARRQALTGRGRARKGDRWLKATLAALRVKGSRFGALYRRICRRAGHNVAIVAVAHAILEIAWQLLAHGTTYHKLGADYLDRRDKLAIGSPCSRSPSRPEWPAADIFQAGPDE
jgi:transposase